MDVGLVLLINLGADRLENPQLIRQNGAMWVGSTTIDGHEVDLVTASAEGATVTYYIDAGGLLWRVDQLNGQSAPTIIEITARETGPLPASPPLTTN